MDDWQQPRRYQPRWSQPKACAGLGSNPSAQRKPVVTPGVESAVDFTKRHHTQTVLLYRPSVKDQLLQELEKRRQQRQQQQAAGAAAAAAAPETTGAGSQGQAGSGVAQPQSPDRLRRAQPQPFPSTTHLAAAPQPTYRPAALPAAAAAAIVAAAVCAAHASAVEEHDTVSDGAGFTPHSCTGLSTAAGPAQQLSEGGSPKRADCTSMPHTAPYKTIPARSESADPRLRHSSFSLVHKQAPVVAFAAPGYRAGPETRRSLSAGHGFSREPGPGAYASVRVADMQTALSTTPRQPSTVFGTSPRVLHASQGSWQPSPRALSAWLASDVGAAMDRTRPRAPVAVVPQALSAPVEPSADLRSANATDDEAVPPLPKFDLVEPRVRSVNLMLPAPQPRAATAGELRLQEREEAAAEERLLSDPWAEDAAVRRRVPMWSFSVATSRHGEAEEENCARPLSDLHPNWQLVKPRLAVGVPDFDKLLKPRAVLLEDRLRLLKQPAVGMYDVEAGLRLLQRHLPTPLLHLMAARWLPSAPAAEAPGSPDVLGVALQAARALDAVRTRVPAALIPPLPTSSSRLVLGPGFSPPGQAAGLSLMANLEAAWAAVLPRLQGGVRFELQAARDEAEHTTTSPALGPGAYKVTHSLVEAHTGTRAFNTYLGHGILDAPDSHDPEDRMQPPPEGAVLQLDVLAAKDSTLRQPRTSVLMNAMQSRDDTPPAPGFGALTRQLGLPDPDLDQASSLRPRLHQVVVEAAGHAEAGQPSSPQALLRGPGAYDVTFSAVRPAAPAYHFARAEGRHTEPDPACLAEGDRLLLSPNADYLRPRPPAALILGPHTSEARQVEGQPEPDLYRHAVYATVDLDMLRPAAPAAVDFSKQAGRPSPPRSPPPVEHHVGAAALSLLAGYPRVMGGLDFATMAPHPSLLPTCPQLEGDRLELQPEAAFNATRRRPQGMPALALQAGHLDATKLQQGDAELTAWLDYQPHLHLVKPAVPPAPDMARALSRPAAAAANPDAAPSAAADLDAGVYYVQHTQVHPDPRTTTFTSTAAARFPAPTDCDEGNSLMLEPQQPQGWRPPVQQDPARQPFTLAQGRWMPAVVDTDTGNQLYLHTSVDDLAHSSRPTRPNAPGLAFGEANRFEQVLKPNENLPAPISRQPTSVQNIETALMAQPPSNQGLELLRQAPHDPRVQALRRRDRVWSRLCARALQEQPRAPPNPQEQQRAAAAADQAALPHAASHPTAAGRQDMASKALLAPSGPRDKAVLRSLIAEQAALQPQPVASPPPVHQHRGGAFHVVPAPSTGQGVAHRRPSLPGVLGAPLPAANKPACAAGGSDSASPPHQSEAAPHHALTSHTAKTNRQRKRMGPPTLASQ
ncbi:hypothetical protein V8C86DRAFT_1135 [Haematococcus lacustris]